MKNLNQIKGELLTAKSIANLLGVDQSTIHNWRNSGRFPEPADCKYIHFRVWHGSDILKAHKAGQLTPRR